MIHHYKLLIKKLIKKYKFFIIYSLIGISGATLDFVFFALLLRIHTNYLLANLISISVGIINNFILNILLNFKIKDKLSTRFISFYLIGMVGLLISSILLSFFVKIFHWPILLSKFFTIFIIIMVQYNLNKKISFKKNNS
jgi:putative flippase GtrA